MPANRSRCRAAVPGLALMLVCSGWLPAGKADNIDTAVAAADADRGQVLGQQCQGCHSVDPAGNVVVGPPLWGVVGRPVASVPGYDYSQSLREIGGNWTFRQLDRYLENPKTLAPQGRMMFPGITSSWDRLAVIAWLRSLSDDSNQAPETSVGLESGEAGQTADPAMAYLPEGEGREQVYYSCSGCHSIRLVAQQGLPRQRWRKLLEWMVEEQGMSPMEPPLDQVVLDYLSEYLGVDHRPNR